MTPVETLTTSDSATIVVTTSRSATDTATLSDVARRIVNPVPTESFAQVTTTSAEIIGTETFI